MVAFVDIWTDARTLNIARTFANNGLKVAVVGLGSQDGIFNNIQRNITFYTITVEKFHKTWQRWLDFYRKSTIVVDDISARYVIAEDVYSLPISRECSKKNKAKLIYDSREIYSKLGPLSNHSGKQKFISLAEKRYIRKVNHIIVTGKRDEDYLRENLTSKIPYSIIGNLSPYKKRVDSNILRNKYNIDIDKYILLYQGMLLNGRGIEKVISSIVHDERFVFVILGNGPTRSELEQLIKKLNMSKRVFLNGPVPYDELHEWTCSADIGISLIEPISKSYELALPNKLFEYIMAGIPTLCSNLPAMQEIIDKYSVGAYLDIDFTNDEFIEKLNWILGNIKVLQNNCELSSQTLSFESQENIIMKLLD